MSDTDVQAEILDPMQRLFLPPRNMEPSQQAEALREYIKALCLFDAGDLREAWGAVRDTHTTRAWPVPAAFIVAAKQARKYRTDGIKDRNAHGQKCETEWDVWVRICRTQMARDAVRNGVSWALKCAILNDKKLPEQIDMRELVSAKASAERTAARIKSDQPHHWKGRDIGTFSPDHAATALKMYAAILQRETETAQEINYGAAA
jgi:hypothetical protein